VNLSAEKNCRTWSAVCRELEADDEGTEDEGADTDMDEDDDDGAGVERKEEVVEPNGAGDVWKGFVAAAPNGELEADVSTAKGEPNAGAEVAVAKGLLLLLSVEPKGDGVEVVAKGLAKPELG